MNHLAFPDEFDSVYIDGKTWEIVKPFRYVDSEFGIITVPSGFRTDYASIPKLFWSIVGSPSNYAPASAVHDYLYRGRILKRKQADEVFFRAMIDSDISHETAYLFYVAVRSFGWITY
jgi:hypothetical protein